VSQDYKRLSDLGIRTIREGLRWPRIENSAGRRDFTEVLPFIKQAEWHGMEIIWDLLHFGWPDHLDPFAEDWAGHVEAFATDFARFLKLHQVSDVWIAPVNEISFLSWAGGDAGWLNPFIQSRGAELKAQLVSGGIAAARAIRREIPLAKFVWPDPVIHITGDNPEAEQYRVSMFEAWDMLAGLQRPELGGNLNLIDVVGVNFYERNQWLNHGRTIHRGDPEYRPFREILAEVYRRYGKPILVSETGIENVARAEWFAYICDEVDAATHAGIPVEGICWYPILNHPGWDDGRHCHNGLWDYADASGEREIYTPLAREIRKRQVNRGVVCNMSKKQLEVSEPDVICLSHLRWDGVFQRPQHLMSRFANRQRVYFIEEPVFGGDDHRLSEKICERSGVNVVTPYLSEAARPCANRIVASLLNDFFAQYRVNAPVAWFYTPMALDWLPSSCQPSVIVYDCMDELSLFRGAPAELTAKEAILFAKADVVFTGGRTLYEKKRGMHDNVHLFPSAVDAVHFASARAVPDNQPDQVSLARPRIGFAGVIDERMDLDLVSQLALLRPNYQFVFLGPVVKIEASALPQAPNLHWLGLKNYQDLPSYFAGWDAAMMPFALNESTRYISPTKTPEYLAAGLPVVSTRIRDVVNPYASLGLVQIADTAEEFANAIDCVLPLVSSTSWQALAWAHVQTLSWDTTWTAMAALLRSPQARLAPELAIPAQEVLVANV